MVELILAAGIATAPVDQTNLQEFEEQKIEVIEETQDAREAQTIHTTQKNENLSKIAQQYNTTWQRLFDKNTHLEHPDILEIGTEIVIPEATEELVRRELPVVAVQTSTNTQNTTRPSHRASSGWFDPSQCTGYVASRRPVGLWNDGHLWYSQAQRDGWATGLTPQAGAIGVAKSGNHVVYIERVDGNRVYLSERNYDWRGSYRERWASASDFRYIY